MSGEYTVALKNTCITHLKMLRICANMAARYETLPPLIRFPNEGVPNRELPYMVQGRVLEIKCALYRPFLYYAIHASADAPYQDMVRPLVDKAVHWHLQLVQSVPKRHRHHGTWFGLRSCATCALGIIAAAKCGTIAMPPDVDWRALVFEFLERMKYWKDEGPGFSRVMEVLETFMEETSA